MSKPHNRDPLRPTPGPWHVSCGSVYGPEGQPIADMDREPGNGTYPTERDRNAQLIAAAPAMRDALRDLYKIAASVRKPDHPAMVAARNALEGVPE